MNNNEEFIYLEDFRNDVNRLIREITVKCNKLEDIYHQYIREVVKKEDHLMSLDILFCQIELTKNDIGNYNSLFNSFLSKMYGQYFKLYKKIIGSLGDIDVKTVFNGVEVIKEFTQYDDLNFKIYDFSETQSIHNNITNILNSIHQYIQKRKYEVQDDEIRTKKGINISHLVYEKTHDIENLKQKLNLFNDILVNYYEYQKKFFRRITLKLKLLYFQIDTDIQFETVTHKCVSRSMTTKLDNVLMNNKTNPDLENILLNELDISHSPPKKKDPITNIFTKFIYFLFCFR